MGEAKRKQEALRQKLLAEIDRWLTPPTEEEAAIVRALDALPRGTIRRASPAELAYMRMKRQECHQNCFSYAQLDPEKKARVVSGWWVRGDVYTFHSVVERDGGMTCITPYMLEEREVEFISDSEIVWNEDADGRKWASRDGKRVPHAVRRDPERTIAESQWVKARLLSGMSPYKAGDLTDFPGS
jgi:hypothetical protein